MIEVEELSEKELTDILERVGYGHLGCCHDDRPYVVPVHYVYSDGVVYIYTTEGKKFEIIRQNPNVCLQVEEVVNGRNWQSVIVEGVATQLRASDDRDGALKLLIQANPTLTPAVSIRWMDSWIRENIEVIYRITPIVLSGRRSVNRLGDPPSISKNKQSLRKIL